MSDDFETWLESRKETAHNAYKSNDSDKQPLGEGYELGMYHAYNKVLDQYRRWDDE
jgi:hypothetical protein